MIDLGTRDPDEEARTMGDSMLGCVREGKGFLGLEIFIYCLLS